MKRVCVFTAAMLPGAISLCGCGQTNKGSNAGNSREPIISLSENASSPVNSTVSESEPPQENHDQSKILIANFTRAENAEKISDADAVASASVSLPGNVGQMASRIQAENQYESDKSECESYAVYKIGKYGY